jgi:hypothetical protein
MQVNRARPEYLEAIDRFLSIAGKYDLKVIFWLGDVCWNFWDPDYYGGMQTYLESLVPHYANDRRIAAWDLMTDLDGAMLQRPPIGGFGVVPHSTKKDMITLLRSMATTVRELDPNHLITVGFCWASSSLLVQDFTDFLMPQFLWGDAPNLLTSDGPAEIEGYGLWGTDHETMVAGLEDKIRSLKSQLERPMPIVLAEYGTPTAGPDYSPAFQAEIYRVVLEMAFLRMELAGTLNWALTDFTWPPKADTVVPTDESVVTPYEQTFGILDLEYQPKPSAAVASAYYADRPQIALFATYTEVTFSFNKSFIPSSGDTRTLCAAFDYIRFLDGNGQTLLELDIGTPQARPYLEKGFFADEGPWSRNAKTFAWAGGTTTSAQIVHVFPDGTQKISFRAFNELDGMQVDISIDGKTITTIPMRMGWRIYEFNIPIQTPFFLGSTQIIHGMMNLPISDGKINLQISYDQNTWEEAGNTDPERGRFSLPVHFEHAGLVLVRATWSGAGLYKAAESNTLTFELPPQPSALSLSPSLEEPSAGIEATISGVLSPPLSGIDISLTFTQPDGSISMREAKTDENGRFRVYFIPDQAGNWRLRAIWKGNRDYQASESSITFQVAEKESSSGLYTAVGFILVIITVGVIFLIYKRKQFA